MARRVMRTVSAPLLISFAFLASPLAAPTTTARADDWLAVMPDCAFGPESRALGRMALLYPRVGLPALVHAGEPLVTRVRVPSGLTPPPGVQQDRALVGWSAVLEGDGVPLGDAVEHRYALRVVDVRPDGPSSLIYRATLRIPHWALPGTYALRMTAPGGADGVAAAVRILAEGAEPTLGLLGSVVGEVEVRPLLSRLARAPVDAWIAVDDPALRAALENAPRQPEPTAPLPALLLLEPDGPPVALRHGRVVSVLGRCEGRYVRFEDQLAGVVARDGLGVRELGPSALPPAGTLSTGPGSPSPLPAIDPLSLERIGGGARLSTTGAVVLTLLLPEDGQATDVTGAEAVFGPATPVRAAGSVPTLGLRLTLPAEARVEVERGPAMPFELSVDIEPREVAANVSATLRARASAPVTRVAWQLAEDDTAVGESARHTWGVLGPHRVHALAIDGRGVSQRATAGVQVVTREVGGCESCALGGPGARLPPELWLALGLVVIRGRRRAGNRPRARGG